MGGGVGVLVGQEAVVGSAYNAIDLSTDESQVMHDIGQPLKA